MSSQAYTTEDLNFLLALAPIIGVITGFIAIIITTRGGYRHPMPAVTVGLITFVLGIVSVVKVRGARRSIALAGLVLAIIFLCLLGFWLFLLLMFYGLQGDWWTY
jgi:hypothetical protein